MKKQITSIAAVGLAAVIIAGARARLWRSLGPYPNTWRAHAIGDSRRDLAKNYGCEEDQQYYKDDGETDKNAYSVRPPSVDVVSNVVP